MEKTNIGKAVVISLILTGIAGAGDIYKINLYTKQKDNVGAVSDADKVKYDDTYAGLTSLNRKFREYTSIDRSDGGVAFEALSSYYKKAAHSQYSANRQAEINGHINSIQPYGSHPAAGSDKQVQVNVKGSPAGAALLNYTGGYTLVRPTGRLGVETNSPVVALHVASENGTSATRGVMSAQHNSGSQAALIQFRKSRGTEASPLTTRHGDFVGFFDTSVYEGSAYVVPAGFGFQVMSSATIGGVKTGRAPTGISFYTGYGIATGRSEKMRITPEGYLGLRTTSPRSVFDCASSVSGKCRGTFGSTTNYGIFDQSLGLRYAGNTTTWEDLRIEPNARGVAGSPVYKSGVGGTSALYSYAFQASGSLEYLYYSLQMPHSWKEGSTIYPHVHFTTSVTSGTVKWRGTCYGANYGDAFVSFGNFSSTTTLSGDAWKHNIGVGTAVSMSGKTVSHVQSCSITRDTTVDTSAADVFMLYIDYHHEVDSTGSDTEYGKTATP